MSDETTAGKGHRSGGAGVADDGRWALLLIPILLLGILTLAFFTGAPKRSGTWGQPADPAAHSLEVMVRDLEWSDEQGSLGGRFAARLIAPPGIDGTLDEFTLSFQHSGERRSSLLLHSQNWSTVREGELRGQDGDQQHYVDVERTAALESVEVRAPAMYPFDRRSFDLRIRGCTAEGARNCVGDGDMQLTRLQIIPRSTALNVTCRDSGGGLLSCDVQRSFLLRLIAVLLLILALLFFWTVIAFETPEKLMLGSLGYFGALWGLRNLIVPRGIEIFPTLVDYVVLSLFVAFFTVIFLRVRPHQEEASRG